MTSIHHPKPRKITHRAEDEARAWFRALVCGIEDALGHTHAQLYQKHSVQWRLLWTTNPQAHPTLSILSSGDQHMVSVMIGTEWMREHLPEMWAQVVAWRLQGIDIEHVIINEEE